MIETLYWPTERVSLFFKSLPWQGYVKPQDNTPGTVEIDWRLLSVGSFFAVIAWDGNPVQTTFGSEKEQALSYTSSVRDFFGCFTWKGQPKIGIIPKLNFNQTTSSDLNISDLSGLF